MQGLLSDEMCYVEFGAGKVIDARLLFCVCLGACLTLSRCALLCLCLAVSHSLSFRVVTAVSTHREVYRMQ